MCSAVWEGIFVTPAEIEGIIMLTCVTGLVGYMGFIVIDLVKRSGVGKLRMYTLLGVLMLAPAVFILKELAALLINL